VIAKIILYS